MGRHAGVPTTALRSRATSLSTAPAARMNGRLSGWTAQNARAIAAISAGIGPGHRHPFVAHTHRTHTKGCTDTPKETEWYGGCGMVTVIGTSEIPKPVSRAPAFLTVCQFLSYTHPTSTF